MEPRWRVDVIPSLGQGQGAGRVGEGVVSSFASQEKLAEEIRTSDPGRETVGSCAVWG